MGAATHYLRLFALTVIACLWVQIIVTIRNKDGEFYDAKRKTALFYMQQVLPETIAIAAIITGGDAALANFEVADFAD
jgi:archaellum biogenesis protein FlaJ (TadC family)